MTTTFTPPLESKQDSYRAVPAFLLQPISDIHEKFPEIDEHERRFANSMPTPLADPVSFKRNRYNKTRPWNHNRIELKEVRNREHPYINASLIDMGRKNEEFIATHGPMVNEAGRFWRLVLQEGSEVIIMLTQPWENGEEKCSVYYPEIVGQVMLVDEEMGLRIECLRIFEESGTEVRELKISMKEKEDLVVWHLLFPAWTDMTIPRPEDEQKLLDLIKMSRFRIDDVEYDKKQTPCGPRMVHCSAGLGRTGTFIALDYLLQEMKTWKKTGQVEGDPIFETVKNLREQRLKTVYKKEQFSFLYQILKDQLRMTSSQKNLQLPSLAKSCSVDAAETDAEKIFGEEMEILFNS